MSFSLKFGDVDGLEFPPSPRFTQEDVLDTPGWYFVYHWDGVPYAWRFICREDGKHDEVADLDLVAAVAAGTWQMIADRTNDQKAKTQMMRWQQVFEAATEVKEDHAS